MEPAMNIHHHHPLHSPMSSLNRIHHPHSQQQFSNNNPMPNTDHITRAHRDMNGVVGGGTDEFPSYDFHPQHKQQHHKDSINPEELSFVSAAPPQGAVVGARSQGPCANCRTYDTPLWRRDGEGNSICNACGELTSVSPIRHFCLFAPLYFTPPLYSVERFPFFFCFPVITSLVRVLHVAQVWMGSGYAGTHRHHAPPRVIVSAL